MKKNELINFENDIAETFNKGKIKAPIHLHGGNEEKWLRTKRRLIEPFSSAPAFSFDR